MSPFGVVCPACGAGMPTGVRFCGKCGATIDPEAPDARDGEGTKQEDEARRPPPVGVRLLLVAWGLGILGGFMLGRGLAPQGALSAGALTPRQAGGEESAASILTRAHAASDAGRYAEARDLYRRAIALDPTNLPAHVDLGIALAALGEDQDARAAFRAALIGDAPHPAAAYNLALLEEEAGHYARARELYGRYLALEPEGRKAAEARAKLAAGGMPVSGTPGAAAQPGSDE